VTSSAPTSPGIRVRRRLAGPWTALTAVVCLAALLAAAAVVEPGPQAGARLVREVGGFLAVGLLLLTSSLCADTARRLGRIRRGDVRVVLARFARAGVSVWASVVVAALLAVPIAIEAWELGASGAEIASAGSGLVAAAACGVALGLAAGVLGLAAAEGTLLAGTLGALMLWPATLGRGAGLSARFPALELPPLVFCALLFAACVAGAVVLAMRRTIGEPGRSVERG